MRRSRRREGPGSPATQPPLKRIRLETGSPAAFGGIVPEPHAALNTLREAAQQKNLEANVVVLQTTMSDYALSGIGKGPSTADMRG